MDTQSAFPTDFDDVFEVAGVAGNQAFLGLDVLRGLVDGISDFRATRQERWRPGLRVTGLALTLPRRTLLITEMAPVPEMKVRLKDVSVF